MILLASAVVAVATLNLVLKATTRHPWVLADSYTHFHVAREMRRRRSWGLRLEHFLYDAAVPDRLDYPPLFATILALLLGADGPARREVLAKWLPAALDTAALLAAALGAWWITEDGVAAVATALVWLASPCTYAQTVALSGRPLGALMGALTFTGLAIAVRDGSALATGVAVAAGGGLFLTNRLGVQAWALLTLALAVVHHTTVPVLVMAAALAAAIAASGGMAWRVHAGHWRHMRRLRRLMPKKGWHQLARVSERRRQPPRRPRLGGALRALTLIDVPAVWIVVALVALDPALGPRLWREQPVAVTWLLSLLAGGMLIQMLRPLHFVGEGFRYFEFALVPLGALVGTAVRAAWGERPAAVVVLAAAAAVLGALQMVRLARASHAEGAQRDRRAVALAGRLRDVPLGRWLVMPLQYAPMLAVESGKSPLMMLGEVGADRSEDFYPLLERPVAELVREFGLEGVFLDTRYAEPEELGIGALAPIDREGPFVAYRIGGADG